MAEGMARLNQQVVGTDYWDRSDRVTPLHGKFSPGASDPAQGNSPVSTDDIRGAVEADVIPRLVPGLETVGQGGAPAGQFSDREIQGFCKLLLGAGDDLVIHSFLADAQARGVPVDLIYLDLFQPAARHIGELWVADLCTFVDVTLAIGTMQRFMRSLGAEFHRNGCSAQAARVALMAPLPGDQHTFGLSMVAEFFRRSGWTVRTAPFASVDELIALVSSSWFTVIGFSVSRDDRLGELEDIIRRIRSESSNPGVGIMAGGPAFVVCPELARRIGADTVSCNAIEALAQAEVFAAR